MHEKAESLQVLATEERNKRDFGLNAVYFGNFNVEH